MLLDFFGGAALTALIVFISYMFVTALPVSDGWKRAVAAILALWIGVQVALASTGLFATDFAVAYTVLGWMVAGPVIAVGIAAWLSKEVRAALLGLPMTVLVGLNIGRVLGFFFLLVAVDGRFGGPFPISAGWGDFITGGGAVVLTLMLLRGSASAAALWVWNTFGVLDLVVAVALAALSANGALTQLILAGEGSDAIVVLPWSLIPSILVPFYIVVHGIIFAQLRERRHVAAAAA